MPERHELPESRVFLAERRGGPCRNRRHDVDCRGGWPVWWPDGKQIAYLNPGPDGNEQVRVVPPAGGASKAIEGLRFSSTNI